MVSERGEFNLMGQGQLSCFFDWFDLDQATRVLKHQSHWKMNTDTLGLKAVIDLHMRHSHHLLILLEERPVAQ